jgi:hypothetical protein
MKWEVMIKDHHEGYIDWEEYERNQKQLAVNNYAFAGGVKSGRGWQGAAVRDDALWPMRKTSKCRLYRQPAKPPSVPLPTW